MGKFLRELNQDQETTILSLVVTSEDDTDETYKTFLNDLGLSIRNLADIRCFNSLICEGDLSSDTLSVINQSTSPPEVSFNVDDTGIITTPFQPHADISRHYLPQQPIPYLTPTRLTFNTVNIDRHNNMDPTWIFHAPVPGAYLVNASIKLYPIPDHQAVTIANSDMTSIYGVVEQYVSSTTDFISITAVAYIPAALYTLCVWATHWDYSAEIKFVTGSCSFTKIG